MLDVPELRVRAVNAAPVHTGRDYVLYWMIAARRSTWNFALDRAAEYAQTLGKPLLVFEPLEVDYPWASARLHRFVIDGMRDNAAAFRDTPVTYFPYVEPRPGAARGLLETLARSACVVVTDDFPSFFLPRIVAAAGARLDVRLEAIDSNGLIPMAAPDKVFTAAAFFRRYVQKNLVEHLKHVPRAMPLVALPSLGAVPTWITDTWAPASDALLNGDPSALAQLPIDHAVAPTAMRGGSRAAADALQSFVANKLLRYSDLHNEPEVDATSRLSPYLHFGHVSAHQVFDRVMGAEGWSMRRVEGKPVTGAREGWWGVSPSTERYLDQLIVWRELGYNMCAKRPDDYDTYESLPEWARATLAKHASDPRPYTYDAATLENATTADPLWNAAQNQLRQDGWMHNYLRMLWGKKILEWSPTPQEALDRMTTIMNRWALDGRNPNSYSGYFWTLGRYDRPWPERPVFGTIRAMSSINTAKKISVKNFIAQYNQAASQRNLPL